MNKISFGLISDPFLIGKISTSLKSGVIDEVFKFVTPAGTLTGIITEDGFNIITEDGQVIIPE